VTTDPLPNPDPTEKVNWLTRPLWKRITLAHLILAVIMLLSALLHFYNISSIGDANAYYTAAVKSMLQSWHNFFFIAAEPGGSITIDKPPLGLWIEAAFAAVLGVSGFSVSLPNILAGIFGIPVLYNLVKRTTGELAGLLAALVMTITPIFVATNRNNTQDGLLVFCLLLAAWAFIKATEGGKLGWLLLGGFIVGLGFNIKMMQAFLPLPAFYALYFFGSRLSWGRKLVHLVLATLVLLGISLSWAVIVDLTPADSRPYIGSSGDNTVMGLIIEHNGLSRLEKVIQPILGTQPQPGSVQVPPPAALNACRDLSTGQSCAFTTENGNMVNGSCITVTNANNLVCAPQGMIPQNGQSPGDGQIPNDDSSPQSSRTPFSKETGEPGILRFFTRPLSKQMSWLLPFALISVLLAAFASKIKLPIETGTHKVLVLWGGWLLTCVVFFSLVSGIFHAYYTIMLVPALGALVGTGFSLLWSWKEEKKWAGIALAVSAGLTIGFQIFSVIRYSNFSWWLLAVGLLLGLGILLMLFNLRPAYFVLLAAMLVIPFYWTAKTVAADADDNLPTAFSGKEKRPANPAPADQRPDDDQAGLKNDADLIEYLQANTQDVEYLLAVPSALQGAQFVLATGRPVLYIGGFSGNDAAISQEEISTMVAGGELRYFYYKNNDETEVKQWLQSTCPVVAQFSQAATNRPANAPQDPDDQSRTLYICR
jgi:4-amino-4-deoxy-L-arabinose transferase-like glycosyltransferase